MIRMMGELVLLLGKGRKNKSLICAEKFVPSTSIDSEWEGS